MTTRKIIRLQGHDYSRNGAYFVTICTKDRQCLFWKDHDLIPVNASATDTTHGVGTAIGRPQGKIKLTEYGQFVKDALRQINDHYPMVFVDKYVIMPNHIHVIIRIDTSGVFCIDGRPMAVPTLSTVINQFKGKVSKMAGFHVWQGRFYDHIIRSEKEYREISGYIRRNPEKWTSDEYFVRK